MHTPFLVLLLAITLGCASTGPPPPTTTLQGKMAPDFVSQRRDGSDLRLSSLRGQVVVLDLWASWCRGCEEKLPALDAMAGRLKSLGIQTLAVSLDEERGPFTRIIDKRSWQMTTLFDSTGTLGDLYQPSELPSVFVIDAEGIVRESFQGYTQSDLSRIEARARALASAPVGDGTP